MFFTLKPTKVAIILCVILHCLTVSAEFSSDELLRLEEEAVKKSNEYNTYYRQHWYAESLENKESADAKKQLLMEQSFEARNKLLLYSQQYAANKAKLEKMWEPPKSINGFYITTKLGDVFQLNENGTVATSVLTSALSQSYDNLEVGRIETVYNYNQDYLYQKHVYIPSDKRQHHYKHCGDIQSVSSTFDVLPVKEALDDPLKAIWAIKSTKYDNSCAVYTIKSDTCSLACSNTQLEHISSGEVIITKDRVRAFQVAKLNEVTFDGLSGEEMQNFLDANFSKNNSGKKHNNLNQQKGYFSPDGACGLVSCAVQDVLDMNMQEAFK